MASNPITYWQIDEEKVETAREVASPCEWRGGARHCSRVMVGESGLVTTDVSVINPGSFFGLEARQIQRLQTQQ